MTRTKHKVGCRCGCCTLTVHTFTCVGDVANGVLVTARRAGHPDVVAVSDASGLARLSIPEPGPYDVILSKSLARSTTTPLDISCPEGLEVDLALGGPVVTVFVSGCRGPSFGLAGCTVTASMAGQTDVVTTYIGGSYTLHLPAVGTWTIAVTHPRLVSPATQAVAATDCNGTYSKTFALGTPAVGYKCGTGCSEPAPETLHADLGFGAFDLVWTSGQGWIGGQVVTAPDPDGGTRDIGIMVKFVGGAIAVATNVTVFGHDPARPSASFTPNPFTQFYAITSPISGSAEYGTTIESCIPLAAHAFLRHPDSNSWFFGDTSPHPGDAGIGGWYTGTVNVYE